MDDVVSYTEFIFMDYVERKKGKLVHMIYLVDLFEEEFVRKSESSTLQPKMTSLGTFYACSTPSRRETNSYRPSLTRELL